MSAVATNSGMKSLKREHFSSSDEGGCLNKRPAYYYMLAPESTDLESSGSESVYSIQAHSTDIAKDTSDTSTECSVIEFDVVSLSEEHVYPFSSQSFDTEPEDINWQPDVKIPALYSDPNLSELSPDSESCFKQKLNIYKNCLLCGLRNNMPHYQYCSRCFKVRKNFFPPRPKKKKNTKKVLQQQDSGISEGFNEPLTLDVPQTHSDRLNNLDNSSEKKELCGTCLIHPKNGVYVHNNIVHRYSCYECSIIIYKKIGRCPVCNTPILRVCKDIVI